MVSRFRANPDPLREHGPFTLERLAKTNHSNEGQNYEALYNLIRYEPDPALLQEYRGWVNDLWEMNWMEGNPLFTWMTLALLPEYHGPRKPGVRSAMPFSVPHADESWRRALDTLKLYPLDRVLHPVMNSLRPEIELNPFTTEGRQSARPLPINQRPLDNEYAWKGNPYQLDGWLKPSLVMFQVACDDPQAAWFCDATGRVFVTLDHGKDWRDVSVGLTGARVQNFIASTNRTFVLWAQTDRGVFLTRDGGLSWSAAPEDGRPAFNAADFKRWSNGDQLKFRIDPEGRLARTADEGRTSSICMKGWRIPRADSVFVTPWGIIAGGPGGAYESRDGENWIELALWEELETGPADFLHAYWMGRYYGFIAKPN